MDDQLLDIYARLNLYELLFETQYADAFRKASDPCG